MKSIFNGYYKLSEEDFKSLWDNAIFIFDTNVLLNLYRYQSPTRDALLAIIERLADRVWIPYHVGLEYQRNRLKVIAAQHKRYSEVQNIVSKSVLGMQNELENLQLKKRHSHINPDKLVEGIEKLKSDFLSELSTLEKQSISVVSKDEIRERIDNLFEGKVGAPPENQEKINDLFKEGEARYRNAIPPGFEDSKKDEKSSDEFSYGGITYKRKYGDLIVWKQIINQAKSKSLKDIIFITDDGKSDWWWKIDSNGKKTIGVRPELTDELSRDAGVERFYAYNTEGFLSNANEQLNAQVTEEAIEEVREVSVARRDLAQEHQNFARLLVNAERAVYDWLWKKFPNLEENLKGYPDFTAHQDNLDYGFEVKLIGKSGRMPCNSKRILHQAYSKLEDYDEIYVILVVLDEGMISRITNLFRRRLSEMEGNLKVIIGIGNLDEENNSVYAFTQCDEIRAGYHI